MRSPLVLLLVATVAVASGCGGGKSDERFIEAADDICRRQHTEIQKIRQPTNRTLGSVAAYLARVAPIVQRTNADLHALRAPSGDRSDGWRQLLVASDSSLTHLQRMLSAAREKNAAAYNLAARQLSADDELFTTTAGGIGLKVCANQA